MFTESQPATILVVDDNAQNLALAEAALEDEGHRTLLASSGAEALERFAGAPVDCVLLDVRMPRMDGLEVCRRIRALPRGSDVPIIFLTAARDLETFDAAREAGGDDFVNKPVRPTELVLRVQAALRLRSLGTELREHYELVRRQRDDLIRLQLQKELLTAYVVHDLKNPVSVMDLHAQLLLRDTTLSEDARSSAATIRSEAVALVRLIMNLLDITRSDEGELRPRRARLDLRALGEEVVALQHGAARANGVHLVCDVGGQTVMNADADMLRRLLDNLVDNAIRHAPRGTTVRILAEHRDGAVELSVGDEGKGVPPGDRERIFERHVRLEEESSSRTGRGLGLAFCKAVALAHGGDIRVGDSEIGTVVCVRLPDVE